MPVRWRHLPLPSLVEQQGINGLETALVLIAFVVIASVFAFAVLTTGLLSSEKSKETIIGGLEETASTVHLRGSVVALATTSLAHISNLRFQVSTVSQAGSGIDFSDNAIVITYIDENNAVNVTTADRTITFLTGGGPVLDADERVEVDIDIDNLATPLTTSNAFTVEIKPSVGAVLTVQKKTPAELTPAMTLN